MIDIVLAEDHHIVRQGLKALLESQSNFRVLGEAADGLAAVDLVEELRPEILVLDWMLPNLGGMEVTRQVRQSSPETRIVVLSMHADESYVLRALNEGANAYVLKDSSASDLIEAIHTCRQGKQYLSAPLSLRSLEGYRQKIDTGELDPLVGLTTREREVLQMVAEGQTNQQIAVRLAISPRTVESHRANLMRKLGMETQADLIHFAVKRGLISVE